MIKVAVPADDWSSGIEPPSSTLDACWQGGTAGLLVGLTAMAFPPSGIVVGGGLTLLIGLWGAGVGGLLTGMVGAAFPSE